MWDAIDRIIADADARLRPMLEQMLRDHPELRAVPTMPARIDPNNESSLERPRRCAHCKFLGTDVRPTPPFPVPLCNTCWATRPRNWRPARDDDEECDGQ